MSAYDLYMVRKTEATLTRREMHATTAGTRTGERGDMVGVWDVWGTFLGYVNVDGRTFYPLPSYTDRGTKRSPLALAIMVRLVRTGLVS